jgi:hypothetical protein
MLSVAMTLHHVPRLLPRIGRPRPSWPGRARLCLGCSSCNIGGRSPRATVPYCRCHPALCRSAPPAMPAPRCCGGVSLGRSRVSPSKLLRCPLLVVLGDALPPRSTSVTSVLTPTPLLAGRWLPVHTTLSTACRARLGDPIPTAKVTRTILSPLPPWPPVPHCVFGVGEPPRFNSPCTPIRRPVPQPPVPTPFWIAHHRALI